MCMTDEGASVGLASEGGLDGESFHEGDGLESGGHTGSVYRAGHVGRVHRFWQ